MMEGSLMLSHVVDDSNMANVLLKILIEALTKGRQPTLKLKVMYRMVALFLLDVPSVEGTILVNA